MMICQETTVGRNTDNSPPLNTFICTRRMINITIFTLALFPMQKSPRSDAKCDWFIVMIMAVVSDPGVAISPRLHYTFRLDIDAAALIRTRMQPQPISNCALYRSAFFSEDLGCQTASAVNRPSHKTRVIVSQLPDGFISSRKRPPYKRRQSIRGRAYGAASDIESSAEVPLGPSICPVILLSPAAATPHPRLTFLFNLPLSPFAHGVPHPGPEVATPFMVILRRAITASATRMPTTSPTNDTLLHNNHSTEQQQQPPNGTFTPFAPGIARFAPIENT
ncbi:hypothetical protein GEV33_014384 [Tenebrio molitor]|uniref:Uncharacterized protein n=1 Tax=Tenebrio molitor TaxID=7067 RepID=A0A8J6H5Q5_TENMO|nr:hypothetical protein GEV33_014384 [Tenebrio molitor]